MGIVQGLFNVAGGGDVEDINNEQVYNEYSGMLGSYARGAPMLFDLQEQFQPKYADLMAAEVNRLTPTAANIVKGASPERTKLIAQMLKSAGEGGLDYGQALPPGLMRLANQTTRAGQAARGMGYGPADAYGETGDAVRLSTELTDRNRQFATSAANTSYALETDPFMRLLQGMIGSSAGQLMSPKDSMSLLTLPFEAQAAQRQANARNATALMTSSGEGFDSFAGAGMGAAGLI